MAPGHEKETTPLHIWLHVQSALLGVIFLSTLVLNSLLLVVLYKMKSRRSNRDCASYNIERSYMFLLFHLALADMLGVILNIPFDILRNAGIAYHFTTAGCKILPPFQLASTTAQTGTYVALSYHRFRAIVHPIRAKLTVCKSLIMIIIIWGISISLSVPYVIVQTFNVTSGECKEGWNYPSSSSIYTFAIFVVQYAAPVILMAIFYITIARTLHEHRIAKELVHVPTQDDVRSHRHIVKMLVTIVTVYSVCMLPHHLFWIVIGFVQDVDDTVKDTVSSVSYLFTYSNSVANPVVFFFYSKESRYHLRRYINKLFCTRSMDVPFEIKKWSATWSGASRSDSQRQQERKSSKDHLKLDKLFPPKPGDSDLGVSLPWEAQVMTSQASSDGYRDYFSSPPIHEHSLAPDDPLEYANDPTNPFMYAGVPQLTRTYPSETTLDMAHENEDSFIDSRTCTGDITEGGESKDEDFGEEMGGCDEPFYDDKDEVFVHTTNENEEKVLFGNCQKNLAGDQDEYLDDEIPSDDEEVETASNCSEDDATRVQHMIERMMQDIRHELKHDGAMNGMKKLEDILSLNESSSNGEWEAMNCGEGLNGSVTHIETSAQNLVKDVMGCHGREKDMNGFREHFENSPETRM